MRHVVGERGTLAVDLAPLCCGHVIPAGATIDIAQERSKNRVWIRHLVSPDGTVHDPPGWHRVKRSAIWFEGER